MQTRVTWLAVTPANSIWRWVPSAGSNSRPSSSQRRKYPLWLRVLVGAWLAVPRTTSSRFATGLGVLERVVAVGELPVGDHLGQLAHHVLEVAVGHHVGEREPDGGELARQVLGVGLGPRRDLTVALDVGPVPVVLPVLREQDQRRRVRGLRGESQVQQDEGVGIPVVDSGER